MNKCNRRRPWGLLSNRVFCPGAEKTWAELCWADLNCAAFLKKTPLCSQAVDFHSPQEGENSYLPTPDLLLLICSGLERQAEHDVYFVLRWSSSFSARILSPVFGVLRGLCFISCSSSAVISCREGRHTSLVKGGQLVHVYLFFDLVALSSAFSNW